MATSLTEIIKDPNYVNANPETQRAIFEKYAPLDPNYSNANAATQQAIRSKFGIAQPSVAKVEEPATPEATLPDWAKSYPNLYGAAQTTRKLLGPTVEALGAAGGGILGTPLGPVGAVGGAGLGYGIANRLLRGADVALGNAPPETATNALLNAGKDVLTGATFEAGGQFVAPYISKAVGKIADLRQMPQQRAADMARQALGPDLPQALDLLKNARAGLTAGQATADITSPTWQALVDRALQRDPRFLMNLKESQGESSLAALQRLVGGATQTEARGAQETAKTELNKALIPVLKTELNAANIAGEKLPALEAEAKRMADAAAAKVEDVRRFNAAKERAPSNPAAANFYNPIFMPRLAAQQTYVGGDLARKAEEVIAQAADASLPFGEASRFAQAAADSLAAHGLTPLKPDSVIRNISASLKNPELAGNRDVATVLKRVSDDIQQWTDKGGVIDAFALDSIRKNSVNGAIRDLYPQANSKAQKELAAKVLESVKPAIVEAIEKAGGTGYGAYLEAYALGRQAISQKKLSTEALHLFESNPKQFVELVRGNKPDEVEKIFGPSSYDIAKEMSNRAMGVLRGVAGRVERNEAVKEQVSAGQDALRQLLQSNVSGIRLPSFLDVKATTANAALDVLEKKIGDKTMKILTEGLKSGKSAEALLRTLPGSERVRVLQVLSSSPFGVSTGTVNMLAPANQNQLAP
jgi:hypothetical protein